VLPVGVLVLLAAPRPPPRTCRRLRGRGVVVPLHPDNDVSTTLGTSSGGSTLTIRSSQARASHGCACAPCPRATRMRTETAARYSTLQRSKDVSPTVGASSCGGTLTIRSSSARGSRGCAPYATATQTRKGTAPRCNTLRMEGNDVSTTVGASSGGGTLTSRSSSAHAASPPIPCWGGCQADSTIWQAHKDNHHAPPHAAKGATGEPRAKGGDKAGLIVKKAIGRGAHSVGGDMEGFIVKDGEGRLHHKGWRRKASLTRRPRPWARRGTPPRAPGPGPR
jgi:hypothetical protein